ALHARMVGHLDSSVRIGGSHRGHQPPARRSSEVSVPSCKRWTYRAAMDFSPSPKSTEYIQRVRRFIQERIAPVEARYWDEVTDRNPSGDWRTWTIPPVLDELKAEARKAGLWNMFL